MMPRRVLQLTVLLAAAGCGIDTNLPTELDDLPGEITADMVTGAALVALRPDGRFESPRPSLSADDMPLEIAQQQALGFVRYARNHGLLVATIGYGIEPNNLSSCDNWFYARSQLHLPDVVGELPPDASIMQRRFYGDHWVVPLCDAERQVKVSVLVAVQANDIRFMNDAPVEPYHALTTAYFGGAIEDGSTNVLPLTGEQAVRFVFEQFGVRISEVPHLFMRGEVGPGLSYRLPGIASARFCNRWRVRLSESVTVKGLTSQSTFSTDELYVAAPSCSAPHATPLLFVPEPTQPADVVVNFIDDSVLPPIFYSTKVPTTGPVHFEPVLKAQP